MAHKCDGCKYKGEHQEMMFKPMGVCHREHNLIEAVKAYNAEKCPFTVDQFGKWISVDERLPKEVEHIIVCDEDGTVGEAIFLKASRRFEWVDNEEIAFATHWMPLPEPPMMKGGAE